jgi:DNA-binding PadR family transcriptional regulator
MHTPAPGDLLPLKTEVLWLLLSLTGGSRHGYALMQDVAERSAGAVRIQTGALYRFLHRMQEDGLVAEAERPADESDERRRYYAITDFGRRVAAAELERMRGLLHEGLEHGLISEGGAS